MLRERHEGRIVTISFRDGDASQAAVFLELATAGLEFELVYGGINDIQGRAFGHLTLAIRGADAATDAALARHRRARRRDGGGVMDRLFELQARVLDRRRRDPVHGRRSRCSSAVPPGSLLGVGALRDPARAACCRTGAVYNVVNVVINFFRPIPFIIFIAAVQPLSRLVIGTGIGNNALIFALSLAASFAIARIVEQNLLTVSPGVIEAARSMGAAPCRILAHGRDPRGARSAHPRATRSCSWRSST